MKCKKCNTEMFVDHVEEKDNQEVFFYKCPNKNCENYWFKENEKDE